MHNLRRNLALLDALSPSAAMAVAEASAPADSSVEEGPRGPVVLVGGRRLASAYDPRAEAAALIEAADIPDVATVVVFGLGLGYHIEELLRRKPDVAVLVVEPSLELVRLAFEARDLSAILVPRVAFVFSEDTVAIREAMQRMSALFTSRPVRLLQHPPSAAVYDYSRARAAVRDGVQWLEMNCKTCFAKGLQCTANALCNIPYIADSAALHPLCDRFRGIPAFCVAAGPSLDRNADELRAVAGRGLIIAVNTAWRALLERGIEPDVVCAIDFREALMRHFEGLTASPTRTALFFDPEVYPGVPATFRGPRLTALVNKPVGAWLARRLPRGIIPKGLTVAHTAFHLAEALGCDPIVLVGQDLSYPGGRSHAGGTAMASEIQVVRRGGREFLKRRMPDGSVRLQELLWVEGEDGERLPTSPDMYSYRTHFEALVAGCRARVINATEGGARIRGARRMSLGEAIGRYCSAPVDFEAALAHAEEATEGCCSPELAEALGEDGEVFSWIAQEARRGGGLVAELRRLEAAGALATKRGPTPAAARLLAEVEGCVRGLMRRDRIAYELVKDAAAADMHVIRRMAQAGRPRVRDEVSGRIARQEAYFEAIACAASTLAGILDSVKRLVAARAREGAVCRR